MKLKMLLILTVLIIYTSSAFAVPTKKYDDITKTLKVIDNGKDVLVIKQQSIVNEITTFEEVFNITAVDNYKFKDKDLTVRWEKFKGIEDILGAELFIKQRISYQVNVPIIGHDLINIPKNKTLNRHGWTTENVIVPNYVQVEKIIGYTTETRYEDKWIPLNIKDKEVFTGDSFEVKVIFKKKIDRTDFRIKTIPSFLGIEEDKMTWWNASWAYVVNNAVPDQIRYFQYQLNLTNLTCANTKYLVCTNGHANPAYTDVRFTLDDTTLLPYYLEINGTNATAYVNVTANGTVNMYYGNTGATTSTSNGTSTFVFYEDFENLNTASLNGQNNWTAVSGTPQVSVRGHYGGAKAYEVYHNIDNGSRNFFNEPLTIGIVDFWFNRSSSTGKDVIYLEQNTAEAQRIVINGLNIKGNALETVAVDTIVANTWNRIGIEFDANLDIWNVSSNNITKATNVAFLNVQTYINSIEFGVGGTAANNYYYHDKIYVRKGRQLDWNTWSVEVTAGVYIEGSIPPSPVLSTYVASNNWVKHLWIAGTDVNLNKTDTYNVSVNGTWVSNGTSNLEWNSTGIAAHGSSNIIVYAYNSSQKGNISLTYASEDVILPNRAVNLNNISRTYLMTSGSNLTINPTTNDADADSITWTSNTTAGTFYSNNGTFYINNWDGNNVTWYIQANDGQGSIEKFNFTLILSTKFNYACNNFVNENGLLNPCFINIPITNPTFINGSYQIKFNITNAMLGGLQRSDFGDIRFRTDMQTLMFYYNDTTSYLNYWIEEKVNSSWISGYVNIPKNLTNISVEWGNHSLASMSSGDGTFLLFDEFNDRTTLNKTYVSNQYTIADCTNLSSVEDFCGFSAITKINGTSVIVVYVEGGFEGDITGRLDYRISNDSGVTWTKNMTLYDASSGNLEQMPSLGITANSTIVGLFANTSGPNMGPTGTDSFRSTDGGKTWTISTVNVIPGSNQYWNFTAGQIITLANGNLFRLLDRYNIGNQDVLISTDDGITWQNIGTAFDGPMLDAPDSLYGAYSDTSCTSYNDGRVICLMRHEHGDNIGVLKNSNNATGTWTKTVIPHAVEITPELNFIGNEIFVSTGRTFPVNEGIIVRRVDADDFWYNTNATYFAGRAVEVQPGHHLESWAQQNLIFINNTIFVNTYDQAGVGLGSNVYLETFNITDVGKTAWHNTQGSNFSVTDGKLHISGPTTIENLGLYYNNISLGIKWKTPAQSNTQVVLATNLKQHNFADVLGIFANYSAGYGVPSDRMTYVASQSAGIGGIEYFPNEAKSPDYNLYELLWNATLSRFLRNDTEINTNTTLPDVNISLGINSTVGNIINYDVIDYVYIRRYIFPEPTLNYTGAMTLTYVPPAPNSISNTTGNFWINYTRAPGSGYLTDSYYTLINGSWINGSIDLFFNSSGMSPHGWANISVYAYNNSGTGSLSLTNASNFTIVPNNIPLVTNTSDIIVNESAKVTIGFGCTDLDSDVCTYGINRSDLFIDFDNNTGIGNWNTDYTDSGSYPVNILAYDGYGGIGSANLTITVLDVVPFILITIPANSWGMFNNWSTYDTTFLKIATNESNDVTYTFYNVSSGEWETYYIGYTYNQNNPLGKHNSVLGFFNAETTISATTVTPSTTNLTSGWNMIYVEGSYNRTLAEIKTDIELDCTLSDIYKYNMTTQDYSNTSTESLVPNEGFIVYIDSNCTWTRTTI